MVLTSAASTDQSDHSFTAGEDDLYVVDVGRPVSHPVIDADELAVFLPRHSVAEALGGDVSWLCGRRLPARGIGVLLAAHMRAVAAETPRLSSSELALAMRVTGDLALATMLDAVSCDTDIDQSAGGLYGAAGLAIDEHCSDPSFSPARLATLIGTSRAKLYRLFAAHGTTVAAAIWQARLKRAHQMLSLPIHRNVPLGEIAYRCGFLDRSTFSRMFKRQYGVTPRDLREDNIAEQTEPPRTPWPSVRNEPHAKKATVQRYHYESHGWFRGPPFLTPPRHQAPQSFLRPLTNGSASLHRRSCAGEDPVHFKKIPAYLHWSIFRRSG